MLMTIQKLTVTISMLITLLCPALTRTRCSNHQWARHMTCAQRLSSGWAVWMSELWLRKWLETTKNQRNCYSWFLILKKLNLTITVEREISHSRNSSVFSRPLSVRFALHLFVCIDVLLGQLLCYETRKECSKCSELASFKKNCW